MSMEQSMRRRSADSVSEEAVHLDSKDLRGLTDCQSFIEGRQCTLGEVGFAEIYWVKFPHSPMLL